MAAEMLSGPDLGGGYLHQLTMDTSRSPNIFTYHAQSGGVDANGPPLGPLDRLDFEHPNAPCPFGGPRCWHREFELPATFQGRVRQSYNRFRFVLATQLEQLYADRAPTISEALSELVARLGEPSTAPEKFWYVGGSTAAWLYGADIAPYDIDLGTTHDGVDRIAQTITEYLVEPVAPTMWGGLRSVYAARAFVGTMKDGARVEWATDRKARPDSGDEEWSGDPKRVRVDPIDHRGHRLLVSRPEYSLLRTIQRGESERADRIAAVVRRIGADRSLIDRLVKRTRLSPAQRDELATRLA